jgi:hypothetical protein
VEFRRTFLNAVKPKKLPATWSVHHDAPREFGYHSVYQDLHAAAAEETASLGGVPSPGNQQAM